MKLWVSSFAAGFALAMLVFGVPRGDVRALAAVDPPPTALRADVFARVARTREASVVFLHTVTEPGHRAAEPALDAPFTLAGPAEDVIEGLGSGVVIDAGGLIVTNAHVVSGVHAIHVRMSDGEDVVARLVGADADTDVALLQAREPRQLGAAPLGDSDRVNVGDIAVAIGNPLGLHHTVTTGVISAKARGLDDSGMEFLQTDAAINPGSSGGPLFDLGGNVIGLTTAILSRFGDNAGLNFAIPINSVRALLPQLRTGAVSHSWLGVAARPLTPAAARARDIQGGVLITGLHPQGPAARAGLRAGDVLLGTRGPEALSPRQIQQHVRHAAPGTTLSLRVWRDGRELTVPVVLEAPPSLD